MSYSENHELLINLLKWASCAACTRYLWYVRVKLSITELIMITLANPKLLSNINYSWTEFKQFIVTVVIGVTRLFRNHQDSPVV